MLIRFYRASYYIVRVGNSFYSIMLPINSWTIFIDLPICVYLDNVNNMLIILEIFLSVLF